MASFQTISSGSASASRSKISGEILCKVCGKECIILLSHSPSNPNREYYSCPQPRDQGGHAWMEWVGQKRAPNDNMVEHLINKVAYCEAKLQFADEVLRVERQRFALIRGQYEKERRKMTYLKYFVKALIAFLCFFYFMSSKKEA